MHTHTGNTHQPDSQLKGSSCSSVIPSHNSRDVIQSHNSRNATCLNPILRHNSRDTFRATTQGTPESRPSRRHHNLVGHAHSHKQSTFASPILLSAAHESLGTTRFQTAWRGTRTARHHTPRNPLPLHYRLVGRPSPSGAFRNVDPLEHWLLPSGLNPTAKRHTSTTHYYGFVALHPIANPRSRNCTPLKY